MQDLDINNLPDDILFGQIFITKEEYLEKLRNGEDVSSAGKSAGIVPDLDNSTDLSGIFENDYNYIQKLISDDFKSRFKFKSGHNSDINPLTVDGVSKIDDSSLVGWTLFNLGNPDWYEDDAILLPEDLYLTNKLETINPSATASDSINAKLEILDDAHFLDILFFDTYQRNGEVGLYLGNGELLTVKESDNDNDIFIENLWSYNDLGYKVYSDYTANFNGTVRRPKKYNSGDFKWYLDTIGR